MNAKQRLSKWMAAAGVASRRSCEEIIFASRVQLNGSIVTAPQTLVSADDTITVDGLPIAPKEQKVYFLLNKPKGFVCSTIGAKKVLDLFVDIPQRLFTIGRLDKDTTGLLLVTNDGHFAHKVIHPSANIHKEYVLKATQEITPEHLVTLRQGAYVEGGFVRPVHVEKVRKNTLKIVVSDGRKREVRQLAEKAGLQVLELKRTRIGGLHLGKLELGQWRVMGEKECQAIFEGSRPSKAYKPGRPHTP